MNAGSFVQYVEQLSMLYQLPYEELKSLSMEYPYFQNLHLLLALKSKLEDHYDYKKNLARAAAYSIDRAKLYRTLSQLESLVQSENFLMHEDYLELQDVNRVAEKLKSMELLPVEQEPVIDLSYLNSKPVAEPSPAPEEPLVSATPDTNPGTGSSRKEENSYAIDLDTITLDNAAIAQCVHQRLRRPPKRRSTPLLSPSLNIEEKKKELKNYLRKMQPEKPKPMPKQSFSTWVEQFQPAHVKPHLSDLMEAKQQEKNKRKKGASPEPKELVGDNLHIFAAKSIQEKPTMASETLAELLVAQMQYRQAIKVYERLSLIFPEKSAFFAEKIENLKKLIS
ncbi:MAG TPA: hypothetical protein VJ953_10660 [Saprospiraceae bacterium]|nr:hypothetical protein [Saprospiraceae bacterium]